MELSFLILIVIDMIEMTIEIRDVIFENYRSLPCGVIDSQSMTRECHADCNITLLLDPKSAESTKEVGVVRSSDKSRIGRGTELVCHCGSSAS